MPEYMMAPNSPQEKFAECRAKIQIFGGGFANGKTAASVVSKILVVAKDYPGCNILAARSTYPKLNDTLRKEFLKWTPKKWIKSFATSKNSDNTCVFVNGSTVNFRYIQQQGKGASEGMMTTSNLLSATYDLIVVDQLEDPEIVYKDFNDLLGRLRGNARYIGDDPTMPTEGPRWFVGLLNPTRNWCYKKIVKPYHDYQRSKDKQYPIISDDLLCARYPVDHPTLAGKPILDTNGRPQLLLEVIEGSTYTNAHNIGKDFIQTLESSYKGSMAKRFINGEWGSYEGLIHSGFDETVHMVPTSQIEDYVVTQLNSHAGLTQVEAYDYGGIVPSCYLFGYVDRYNNVIICDGFYKPTEEFSIEDQQRAIARIRDRWGANQENKIICDPAITKKTVVQRVGKSKSIAEVFGEGLAGVKMTAGDNNVMAGILKVNQYLDIAKTHYNPFTQELGAPHLYFNDTLEFVSNEMASYYWQRDSSGTLIDKPVDKDDHAMNTLKYMISKLPTLKLFVPKVIDNSHLYSWTEAAD